MSQCPETVYRGHDILMHSLQRVEDLSCLGYILWNQNEPGSKSCSVSHSLWSLGQIISLLGLSFLTFYRGSIATYKDSKKD